MVDPFFETQEKLTQALFRNVSNISDVKKFVQAASLPFALVKPKYIVDKFQLSVAITKALYNQKEQSMKTSSLQTEIIYCLSPSRSISLSLNTFGSDDHDSDLLVIGSEKLFDAVRTSIKGEQVPLEQIKNYTDIDAVVGVYGISPVELETASLLNAVISRISSKDSRSND